MTNLENDHRFISNEYISIRMRPFGKPIAKLTAFSSVLLLLHWAFTAIDHRIFLSSGKFLCHGLIRFFVFFAAFSSALLLLHQA